MTGLFTGQALAQGVSAYDKSVAQQDALQTSGLNREAKQQAMLAQKQQMQGQQIQNQQNQNVLDEQMQFKIQQQDMEIAKGISSKAFNNYFEHMSEGEVGKGIKSFNKLIKSNPMLSEMMGEVSPIDANFDKNKMIAYMKEINPDFDSSVIDEEMMKNLATSGAFVKDKEGNVVDVQGVAIQTGEWDNLTSRGRQAMNDNISAMKGALTDKTASTHRPTNIAEMERLVYQNAARQFETGSPEYNDYVTKGLKKVEQASQEGKSGVKQTEDQNDKVKAKSAWTVFKDTGDWEGKSKSDLSELQERAEAQKHPRYKETHKLVKDTEQVLKLADQINDKVATAIKGGKGAEMIRGPLENLQKWSSKFFSAEEQVWSPDKVDSILNTVSVDTEMGMLVQQYVKSISGATVTDAERDFFMNTLTAGNMSDPVFLEKAMNTFENVIVDRQKMNADTLGEIGAVYDASLAMSRIPKKRTGSVVQKQETPEKKKAPKPTEWKKGDAVPEGYKLQRNRGTGAERIVKV